MSKLLGEGGFTLLDSIDLFCVTRVDTTIVIYGCIYLEPFYHSDNPSIAPSAYPYHDRYLGAALSRASGVSS